MKKLNYKLRTKVQRLNSVVDMIENEELSLVQIEYLADYLLSSEDIVKDDKVEYRFYKDKEEFKQKTKKTLNCIENDDVLDFLVQGGSKTIKKEKKQIITEGDLKESSYKGNILREYDSYKNIVGKDKTINKRKRINLTGYINQDMLDTKDILDGTFGYVLRNPLKESTVIDWDMLDLTNHKHIKALFFNLDRAFNIDDDLSLIVNDFNKELPKIYRGTSLTDEQKKIIEMFKKGYELEEIIEKTGIEHRNINDTLKCISQKIARYYKKILK